MKPSWGRACTNQMRQDRLDGFRRHAYLAQVWVKNSFRGFRLVRGGA